MIHGSILVYCSKIFLNRTGQIHEHDIRTSKLDNPPSLFVAAPSEVHTSNVSWLAISLLLICHHDYLRSRI
jgi:hypothetical protein